MIRMERKASVLKRLAAGAAVIALGFIVSTVSSNAEVADESTYDSSVKGTDQTYYRTIATNFHAGSIPGLVTLTSALDMDTAANITSEGKKNGYEPVLYVNAYDWNSDERKQAEKVVQEMNGTLVTMLDIQLFRYEVSAYTPVNDAGAMVTLISGIPQKAHKDGNEYKVIVEDGREFAMVRVHNGQVSVLKDQDTDPKTLTFQTDKFSVYGLMYAPAGEIDKYLNGGTGDGAKQEAAAKPSQQASQAPAEQQKNPAGDAGELDDVPKTGDILWEIEYGYCAE